MTTCLNKQIWKFPLEITDKQTIEMPGFAEILYVGRQHGELYIWAMLNDINSPQRRTFHIIGTGNPMPDADLTHIGTVIMNPFVWHVFEEESK